MSRDPVILPASKTNLKVLFDTVSIEIVCADDYEAQVLFDDICDRLKAGEIFSMRMKPEERAANHAKDTP